jgi:hypothetical protein
MERDWAGQQCNALVAHAICDVLMVSIQAA